MKRLYIILAAAAAVALSAFGAAAQEIPDDVRATIGDRLTRFTADKAINTGRVRVDSIGVRGRRVSIFTGANLAYVPLSRADVDKIYAHVREALPPEFNNHRLELITDSRPLEELVRFGKKKKELFANRVSGPPLVTNLSRPHTPGKGMQGHHLALWQSHGRYYEQKLARWEWQRARLFQTVEDLYTQSYVLPYLVPMLENAGATVMLPRERDVRRHEVIVDNDGNGDIDSGRPGGSKYIESVGKESWQTGTGSGFAHLKEVYLDGENPFREGSFRQVKTVSKGAASHSEWIPDIPEKGTYAVYVAYQTLPGSTSDALYTVSHAGGQTAFSVNQTMGGGTWIYLGSFVFEKGTNHKITLSNLSATSGRILTADAVKIGGGMGNIARRPHPGGALTANTKSSESIAGEAPEAPQRTLPQITYLPETSGYPRYTEGARYWLQWAGMPDSVYNRSAGLNDYTDDYQSRGFWVNHLAGGSPVLPEREGLNIPIDLAMAFHTDAGTTFNDSIIGTLGIYMTHSGGEKFENGKTRWSSRDLTESVMDEIVRDIRRRWEPDWTRRAMWNSSYSEARVPNVPTMLLELLSHQNFADMKYGLDPRFRFTVSRAIYKGMLRFVAAQYGFEAVVQPLPVRAFSTEFEGRDAVRLRWRPTLDEAEPTAVAERYVVYTRIGDGGWDNGRVVEGTDAVLPIALDTIHSFRVAALNDGGESFPSEILSVCRLSNERGIVLVANAFDRLSAPGSFASRDSIAGFVDALDHGVADRVDWGYIGSQHEFRRDVPWMDDDSGGFGASNSNYESAPVAGNTFDYPALHGKSIVRAGWSFVSTSRDALTAGEVDPADYRALDLILGEQRRTLIGRGTAPMEFKTFPEELQRAIAGYCGRGGNVFVSGAYVASDLWDTPAAIEADKQFAESVLKYTWRAGHAAVTGRVKAAASPFPEFEGTWEFHTEHNPEAYAVESPDAIEPAGRDACTLMRYSENNLSAAVAYRGDYRTCVMGFPFEAIKTDGERDRLMAAILTFFD
jgi:hypothetical protein